MPRSRPAGRVAAFDTVQQKHLPGNETAGVRVSLRGPEAYEFLEKLALLLLPQQVGGAASVGMCVCVGETLALLLLLPPQQQVGVRACRWWLVGLHVVGGCVVWWGLGGDDGAGA